MEREKEELKKRMHEQQLSESPSKNSFALLREDLEAELKTLRELCAMQESTINDLRMKLREL